MSSGRHGFKTVGVMVGVGVRVNTQASKESCLSKMPVLPTSALFLSVATNWNCTQGSIYESTDFISCGMRSCVKEPRPSLSMVMLVQSLFAPVDLLTKRVNNTTNSAFDELAATAENLIEAGLQSFPR